MRMAKLMIVLVLAALALSAGWQIASVELANMNLQEEMRDLASQAGAHVGFVPPSSDEDAKQSVVRKAKEHGIDITPEQVTVVRRGSEDHSTLHLSADYYVHVSLGLFSFQMHFTPST